MVLEQGLNQIKIKLRKIKVQTKGKGEIRGMKRKEKDPWL